MDKGCDRKRGMYFATGFLYLCSDEYLYNLNQEYLNHDTYTDIITLLDYTEPPAPNDRRDIFISVDRVKDNAVNLGRLSSRVASRDDPWHTSFCGYPDKSPGEKPVCVKRGRGAEVASAITVYSSFFLASPLSSSPYKIP